MKTTQLNHWLGKFGQDYTDRNDTGLVAIEELNQKAFGQTLSQIYRSFFNRLPIRSILEVGCNVGNQLAILSQLGNYCLVGVEPQFYAIKQAQKHNPQISFVAGTAFNLPFADDSFDLVFTRGVLIHIHPQNLPQALQEIYRVSKHYLAGFEYYAKRTISVKYRGQASLLWKNDYQKQYLKSFPHLKVLKSQILEFHPSIYGRRGLYEQHFLLQKPKS